MPKSRQVQVDRQTVRFSALYIRNIVDSCYMDPKNCISICSLQIIYLDLAYKLLFNLETEKWINQCMYMYVDQSF